MPGRGKLGPRREGDVALDLGAGVQRLDVDAADLLGDVAAEQAAERVADRAGGLRRQRARDVEGSCQRRRQREHVLCAARRDRTARRRPADIGVLENLRYRIVGLACEVARRAALGGVANRGKRNRCGRKDAGAARYWWQRRQFDKRRRCHPAMRRQPVHQLQTDKKRKHDHRQAKQDRLLTYNQTHHLPEPIQPESLQGGFRRRQRDQRPQPFMTSGMRQHRVWVAATASVAGLK